MDVLCTDKTGTLTLDRVILQQHCDVVREDDDNVLLLAYLNSHFQTGLKNVLDRAVLNHEKARAMPASDYKKVDEIPFDFQRRLMSVVVETPDHRASARLQRAHRRNCSSAARPSSWTERLYPIEQILIEDLREEYERLVERRLSRAGDRLSRRRRPEAASIRRTTSRISSCAATSPSSIRRRRRPGRRSTPCGSTASM